MPSNVTAKGETVYPRYNPPGDMITFFVWVVRITLLGQQTILQLQCCPRLKLRRKEANMIYCASYTYLGVIIFRRNIFKNKTKKFTRTRVL